MDKIIDVAWEITVMAVKLLVVMIIVGLLFALWFAASFSFWGSFGTDAFQWWLMISALAVAIFLVAIW